METRLRKHPEHTRNFISHDGVTCPKLQKQFNVIEEHCVVFYVKFVIDDQVGSRVINVIQNILFINK